MIEISSTRRAETGLNITPLVDIVFLLLIFFLLTAFFIKPQGLSVNLPRADAPPAPAEEEVVVVVEEGGLIKLSGVMVSLDELESQVKTALSSRPESPVLIKADSKVNLERAVQVMERCNNAGAHRLIIATESPAR